MRVFDAASEVRAGAGGVQLRETRPAFVPGLRDAIRRLPRTLEPWVDQRFCLALLMLAVALAARAAQFGNPVVQVDDQFYLLMGDRMLDGALPYVDIWDRKPIGLFLIYAGIRLLGGSGVLEYQLVATIAAAATGYAIARIARQVAPPHGAAAAGLVYILYLGIFGGEAGQSPVFYNLLVVLAAGAMLRALLRPGFGRASFFWGLAATGLMGLALQVKYTVLFEGAFFGLALMWRARREGVATARIVAMGAAWLGAALLPTAIAWGGYAAIGHGADFYQANFESIFHRNPDEPWALFKRLGWIAMMLAPLGIVTWSGRVQLAGNRSADPRATHFLTGWMLAALTGFILFGSWFDHYALPLLVPMAVLAAPALGLRGAGLTLSTPGVRWHVPAGLALMLFASIASMMLIDNNRRQRGWGPQLAELAGFIQPRLQGCLFVYDGPVALYRVTGSCLPSRWAFPDHLYNRREEGAIGTDTLGEAERIMGNKPKLVVRGERVEGHSNLRTWNYVDSELARAYDPAFRTLTGGRRYIVWERRPGM